MRSLADSPLSSGTHSPSPDRIPMTEALPAIGDCSIDSTATLFHREPAVIGPITATLIQASIAASTRRAYRGALGRLDAWLGGRVLDDHALSEWITVLHDRGLSVSSASLAVGAARFRARMAGLEDPAGPLTLRTLAGIRRSSTGRGRGQVAGIPWEEADLVVDGAMGEGTIRGLRDAALIAVGSDALLRVGEMVAIDVCDIERASDGSAVLHIRRSKTDQEGVGATCYLGRRTVEVLDAWMASAGIGQDGSSHEAPVFRSVRKGGGIGDRLSCRSARSIVIRRCGRGNGDNGGAGRISGHSLRVGSAISLARAGASLVELQQAGRWKSPEMPARYTRGESARRGPVARLRHGQAVERRREAGDCPGAGGFSGRPGADTTQDIEQEPGPDDGLTPGIRFNGARAGNSAVPIEACEQARPCSPASSPGIGEPASGGLIGTYKQEGPMSNRQPVRGERGFSSFRHTCLPWGLGASLVPLDRMNRTNERKKTMKQKPSATRSFAGTERIRAVLAAIFLSLVLAACGGGGGSGSGGMPGTGNTGGDSGSNDHPDTPAGATTIMPDSPTAGRIDSATDVDHFRVGIEEEGALTVNTSGEANPFIQVYDADGDEIPGTAGSWVVVIDGSILQKGNYVIVRLSGGIPGQSYLLTTQFVDSAETGLVPDPDPLLSGTSDGYVTPAHADSAADTVDSMRGTPFRTLSSSIKRYWGSRGSSGGRTVPGDSSAYVASITENTDGGATAVFIVNGRQHVVNFPKDKFRDGLPWPDSAVRITKGDSGSKPYDGYLLEQETLSTTEPHVLNRDYYRLAYWGYNFGTFHPDRADDEFRGYHADDPTHDGRLVYGVRTEPENLPSGTASYSGQFSAHVINDVNRPKYRYNRTALWGPLSLEADLGTLTVTGEVSGLWMRATPEDGDGWTELSETTSIAISGGDISGGRFVASWAGQDTDPDNPNATSTRGFSGAMIGDFYGPNAEEVAGVINGQRAAAGGNPGQVVFGVFGAEKAE